jgi:hypothetical protein
VLSVAIIGTLSVPRKEAAALIDSASNARFHPDVSYQTSYLVAALFNSGKARKAAQIDVTIITEAEMMEYVKAGRFAETSTPTRPPHVSNPGHCLVRQTLSRSAVLPGIRRERRRNYAPVCDGCQRRQGQQRAELHWGV